MYFRYQCIHWYKYENDEVESILPRKCTVLCYILEYIYIVQIEKRRTSPVFAFNMQIPDQVEFLVVFACCDQRSKVSGLKTRSHWFDSRRTYIFIMNFRFFSVLH